MEHKLRFEKIDEMCRVELPNQELTGTITKYLHERANGVEVLEITIKELDGQLKDTK